MSNGLTIKEVADASGFTAAALRYYEQLGILPEAPRTPAGYRRYDEQTLARLAFVARAKQLGCSLDEISGLITAWDGGRCGPVQDQLRPLVAGKIAAAQTRIGELMTFTAQLQAAAAALEGHRPEGGCDDHCGCLTDPDSSALTSSSTLTSSSARSSSSALTPTRPVALTTKPSAAAEQPAIACTLPAGAIPARGAYWQALVSHVVDRQAVPGGVRLTLGAEVPTGELMRLVAAEQECCRFFQFTITVDRGGITLEVRAPAEASAIVTSMFGTPA